jgi:N-dimethylarginine dimethylaminohydrolase
MPRLLLCPPTHYRIAYEINPWMLRSRDADPVKARRQWNALHEILLSLGAGIELVEPQPGLPDMVFTANAGLAVDHQFIPSQFRFPERQGERARFEQWFGDHGYAIHALPDGLCFEGEGDALFCGGILFCGYRFRSDIRSHRYLGERLGCLVTSLELADARYYHLDTCFCPLGDGLALWYPDAFDEYGRRAVRGHVRELIEVTPDEAAGFACNALAWDRHVILPDGCPRIVSVLTERGYACHPLAMTEFIKAGGACKCLALFLPQRTMAPAATRRAAGGERAGRSQGRTGGQLATGR